MNYEPDYGYDQYAQPGIPRSTSQNRIPHSTSQGRIHRSISPGPSVDYGGLPYDRGSDVYQPGQQQGGWEYRR